MFIFPPKPRFISENSLLFKSLDKDKNWICEPKINGKRILVLEEKGVLNFYTRNGNLFRRELVKGLDGIGLDMEYKDNLFYVFDIFLFRSQRITNFPLWKRKEILGTLKLPQDFLLLKYRVEDKISFYKECLKKGYEGVVTKFLDSVYEFSLKRSPIVSCWLKIKPKL
jgi:ATP-dependent DNA ligase